MLSDEEKQAIKVLNHFNPVDCGREDTQAIETILNLIEKQQKEIEELKKENKELIKERATEIVYVDKNFVRKDKIKAILEEYKYTEIGDSEKIIEFYKKMQSLLEKE